MRASPSGLGRPETRRIRARVPIGAPTPEELRQQHGTLIRAQSPNDFGMMPDMRVPRYVPHRSTGPKLLIPGAKDHPVHMRLDNRTRAHRARLQSNDQGAAREIPQGGPTGGRTTSYRTTIADRPDTDRPGGLTNGLDLRMGKRVVGLASVAAPADADPRRIQDDGSDGHLARPPGLPGQGQGLRHPFVISHEAHTSAAEAHGAFRRCPRTTRYRPHITRPHMRNRRARRNHPPTRRPYSMRYIHQLGTSIGSGS